MVCVAMGAAGGVGMVCVVTCFPGARGAAGGGDCLGAHGHHDGCNGSRMVGVLFICLFERSLFEYRPFY